MNNIKKIMLVICLGSVCAYHTYANTNVKDSYVGSANDLHIYLLIGQSNMAGRAPFTKEEAEVIPNCYLLNDSNKWEEASNPLNKYSTIRKHIGMQRLNPGYMFAKTMLTNNVDVSIGLIVNAKGGASIEQWAKDARSQFYSDAVNRTKIAQKTGVLKGILWHQGESNQKDEKYLEKLQKLVKDFRDEFGIADLPFIAGEINDCQLINKQLGKLPGTVLNTAVVKSEGLTTLSNGKDRWHFDSASMRIMGERYAKKMLKIQQSNKK